VIIVNHFDNLHEMRYRLPHDPAHR
jgi:hypothetical protein